jgi:hypothetical protein
MLSGCAFIGRLFGGDTAGGIEIITRPHAAGTQGGNVMAPIDLEDTLEIVHRVDGGVDFRLSLIANAGRDCRLRGTALPVAGGYEFRSGEPADRAASQCRLRLHRDAAGWRMSDADGHCAVEYCGDGMRIDGMLFRAAPSPLE